MTSLSPKGCLVVLDNVATVLRSELAGYYLDGYEGFGHLLFAPDVKFTEVNCSWEIS